MMVIRFCLLSTILLLKDILTTGINICIILHSEEECEKAFAYFWITDSCPFTVKAIENRPPFEVLSLAGSIADALQI